MSAGEAEKTITTMSWIKRWLEANGKTQRWLIEKIRLKGVFVDDAYMSKLLHMHACSRRVEDAALSVIGDEVFNEAHSKTHI